MQTIWLLMGIDATITVSDAIRYSGIKESHVIIDLEKMNYAVNLVVF